MTRWRASGIRTRTGSFALGPVDLEVVSGEVLAILGPTGAGKTTLLRALAGLVPCAAGSVVRDDTDVTDVPPEHRGLGFVPPGFGLFPHLTVRDNVAYAARVRGAANPREASRAWLERWGLVRLADRYPNELSEGERQRVALARSLAAAPQLLLWDEPLSHVDVDTRDGLIELVRSAAADPGIPCVLVTHDPATAFSLADRILVLEDGQCVFDGAPAQLWEASLTPFLARFVGYENVYTRDALETGAPRDGFAAALLHGAGPGGAALSAGAVRWSVRAFGNGSTARVRRARRTPGNSEFVAATAGGLAIAVRGRPDDPIPVAGSYVDLRWEPGAVRPLRSGGSSRGRTEAPEVGRGGGRGATAAT